MYEPGLDEVVQGLGAFGVPLFPLPLFLRQRAFAVRVRLPTPGKGRRRDTHIKVCTHGISLHKRENALSQVGTLYAKKTVSRG